MRRRSRPPRAPCNKRARPALHDRCGAERKGRAADLGPVQRTRDPWSSPKTRHGELIGKRSPQPVRVQLPSSVNPPGQPRDCISPFWRHELAVRCPCASPLRSFRLHVRDHVMVGPSDSLRPCLLLSRDTCMQVKIMIDSPALMRDDYVRSNEPSRAACRMLSERRRVMSREVPRVAKLLADFHCRAHNQHRTRFIWLKPANSAGRASPVMAFIGPKWPGPDATPRPQRAEVGRATSSPGPMKVRDELAC